MRARASTLAVLVALGLIVPAAAFAQSATYHLHNENSSTTGLRQLKTSGPDTVSIGIQTPDLKNQGASDGTIGVFDTQLGVPGLGGIIAANSTLSFTLWMKKTAALGTVFPRVSAGLNWGTGVFLCSSVNGSTAIGTTQTSYLVTCATGAAAIPMSTTDRIWVSVQYHMTAGPGNKSMKVELDIEGTLNGATDSFVTVPNPAPPTITSLSATNGYVSQALTVNGNNFGASQGSSSVQFFNGTNAAVTSWTNTAVGVTVPAGATTGPVVVRVGGQASNGVTFTVVPHLTLLNPTSGPGGQAVTITGTSFGATQGASTVTFNGVAAAVTSWADTSIGATAPSGVATGPVAVTVGGNASNGLTFTAVIPTITSLSATTGIVGQSITISGTQFQATQGSSAVTFNGHTATVTSWAASSIDATVPVGATTGPVLVTVGGNASNGITFTVITTGTLAGTITHATGGAALSGTTVQAVLTGIIRGSATSAADGSYSIPNLDPGSYDVRVLASGYSTEVRSATHISVNATTTLNVGMTQPGSISGKVTQADGTTPIAGAAVTLYSGPVQTGSASTNATGDYAIANIHPGAYTAKASNASNRPKEQGATILEGTNTTANISLDPAGTGPVSYAYDDLGRLTEVTDASGDSAIYHYDSVGNLTGIERPTSGTVAIASFTPISGTVGTAVTIYGTGFSTTPGQNGVTFNGSPVA